MLCTVTEQVLVAIYLEQQKEVPHMMRLTHGLLDLSPEKFTAAIERLRHDRLIKNVEVIEDDAGTPLFAFIEQTRLTMAGQEYIENKFSLGDWWAQTKKSNRSSRFCWRPGFTRWQSWPAMCSNCF